MKRSVSAKDQLEDFSNEAHPTVLFKRIFLGSLSPLKFSNVVRWDVLLHKYCTDNQINIIISELPEASGGSFSVKRLVSSCGVGSDQ